MGMLVNGKWQDVWYDTSATSGRFVRQESAFRNWVTTDGGAGPTGEGGFPAERGRYHLYVSLACPWAHRTLIMRRLKGLQDAVSLSVVHWRMREEGWTFAPGPCVTGDPVNGARTLYQVYVKADPHYTGRVTTPVLWDTARGTIVSNESADILRMFNGAFDGLGATPGDYYPAPLRAEIEALNDRIYKNVNNGVYRAGFATTQEAYEEAVVPLFETLDWLEGRLWGSRWLTGDRLTEADIRLFTTLVRFDTVYYGHFKCNLRRIVDCPALWRFTRDICNLPGVRETVNQYHIKHHYYESHATINPSGTVPLGPIIDFAMPPAHRAQLDPRTGDPDLKGTK
ncbi:MAG: glutathione S-transferase family protein [Alphaproteobacteria bacterium]|nr:glutathione S-transferase family protein [Alphaproteobacteria bacterium]